MRYLIVALMFFIFDDFTIIPVYGAAAYYGLVLIDLAWGLGNRFAVLSDRWFKLVVDAAPKRPQRRRIKLTGLREPVLALKR